MTCIRTGHVVHAEGFAFLTGGVTTMLACRGRVAASSATPVGDAPVTCLWCIAGATDPELRWFKWADET